MSQVTCCPPGSAPVRTARCTWGFCQVKATRVPSISTVCEVSYSEPEWWAAAGWGDDKAARSVSTAMRMTAATVSRDEGRSERNSWRLFSDGCGSTLRVDILGRSLPCRGLRRQLTRGNTGSGHSAQGRAVPEHLGRGTGLSLRPGHLSTLRLVHRSRSQSMGCFAAAEIPS